MSDGVLVRLAPEDLLVRKNARFTHDRMNFHHDVRGKRFNAHGESHNIEKTISKDHVAEKPGRHKHHHDYLRSKLSGRGHGVFCN